MSTAYVLVVTFFTAYSGYGVSIAPAGEWIKVGGANSHAFDLRIVVDEPTEPCIAFSGGRNADFIVAAQPSTIIQVCADVAKLEATNERWRQNSINTWAAMTAMRNNINEYIPMPSLESDLLEGPENSVFCAAVAQAVCADRKALLDRIEAAESIMRIMVEQLERWGGDGSSSGATEFLARSTLSRERGE